MVFSVQQIKFELLAYMKEFGGAFGDWYVGVSNDAEEALFAQHGVRRDEDIWIYKPALTGKATHTVLRYFRGVLHTDGPSDTDVVSDAIFAYAFKKSPNTNPRSNRGNAEDATSTLGDTLQGS